MSESKDGYEFGRESGMEAVSRGGGFAFAHEHFTNAIGGLMAFDADSDFQKGVEAGLEDVQEEFENGDYNTSDSDNSDDNDDSEDDDDNSSDDDSDSSDDDDD